MSDDLFGQAEQLAPAKPLTPAQPAAPAPTPVAGVFGADLFGEPRQLERTGLGKKFGGIAPLTVLNAASGEWQERKEHWAAFGCHEERGRAEGLVFGEERQDPFGALMQSSGPTTSIFDPVLAEMAYRWFCPPGGLILDSFAGGAVRGIVAGAMGRRYLGIELRAEQIAANEAAADKALKENRTHVRWIKGDAREAYHLVPGAVDFLFSCPPYGDLERYSDDPRDLSTMRPDDFDAAYKLAIHAACQRLLPNRFAAFVVGDYRRSDGSLRSLAKITIEAFEWGGLQLYNHAIYQTPAGSVGLRLSNYFAGSRKLGSVHQHLLVFLSGDSEKAAARVRKGDPTP